jgi:hypothetical protein
MCLSQRRIKVEHVFKEMKTYKAVGNIWRHVPKMASPSLRGAYCFLAERRVRLFS